MKSPGARFARGSPSEGQTMDDFPYLITLFIFTAIAVFLYAGKTKRNAEKAMQDDSPSTVRMAVERSPSGKIMADSIEERRNASAKEG